MSNTTRMGACVPSAYEDSITKFKHMQQDIVIVHGWIWSFGLNKLIKHAWIEFINDPALANTIYEPVTEQFMDKDKAQRDYKLQAVKRYTFYQIEALSWKTNSKGGVFEF